MKRHVKLTVLLVATLAFAFAFAAASPAADDQDAKQSLTERAHIFWNARVKGDWDSVYNLLAAEDKAHFTSEEFVAHRKEKGPFRFLSAKLEDVAVAGDLGWVKVDYTIQSAVFPDVPARDVQGWDIWQQRDGQWYPILKKAQRKRLPQLPPHMRPAEEEALLAQRANELWSAKEKEDWTLIYPYLEPAFRDKVSEEEFQKSNALSAYLSHTLEWVEVIGDRGRVKVVYTHTPNAPALTKLEPEPDVMIEQWVKVDGQWYRRMQADGNR
jgi:hypothetical protein